MLDQSTRFGKERLRAPFQWFGGKSNMLAKLTPLVPAGGRPYCEPYAGAASLFFARDPAPLEVLNDLDARIVNLFQDHDHHVALVETILACQGAVVLSGYDHPVYQPLVDAGWEVTRFETACHAVGKTRGSGLQGKGAVKAKAPRTEVVWRNPRAVELNRHGP